MSKKNITLEWFGHSVIKMQINDKTLFFDPIRKNKMLETTLEPAIEKNASAILISHEHWDHYDADTVISLTSSDTKIYCPSLVAGLYSCRLSFEAKDMGTFQEILKSLHPVEINENIDIDGISVKCLEATEGISYLIEFNQKKILFMGDSIAMGRMIEEKPDIIIFPIWAVEGEEADLNNFLKLAGESICIPMHYHSNPDSLPNFFIEPDLLYDISQKINLKVLKRNAPIVI